MRVFALDPNLRLAHPGRIIKKRGELGSSAASALNPSLCKS
jgi:hypothetical protein